MKHILIIEDEEQVQGLLRTMLENAGYAVSVAGDGVAGLAAFRQNRADLVVTDIMMPEKDGVETIREIRKTSSQVKIIAITGYRGPFNRLPAAEYVGAQKTLVKPFRKAQLLEAVEDLLKN